MPAPLFAPTLFALATGVVIGAGVAAIVYETELVEDIKLGIKLGIESFVEKRKKRENAVANASSSSNSQQHEMQERRSEGSSSPFLGFDEDLYHTPTSSQNLNRLRFGSTDEEECSSPDGEGSTRLRKRGERRGVSSNESLFKSVPKRFRTSEDDPILLFPGASTTQSESESATTPFETALSTDEADLSTVDTESNFSDPVMIELTSDEEAEQAVTSSVSTLRQAQFN